MNAKYRPVTFGRDTEPIEIRCCFVLADDQQCPNDGEIDILTSRICGGFAGPDPYADETFSCEEHVGVMLGHQPDAVKTDEIFWQVFRLQAVES